MDTRVALGGDGGGRYDTLEGGETVSRPELVNHLRAGGALTRLSVRYEPASPPPSATRVSTDTSHYVREVPLLGKPTESQTRAPGPFAI